VTGRKAYRLLWSSPSIAFLRGRDRRGCESAAPQEISETAIGSYGVPFWIHQKKDEVHVASIVSIYLPASSVRYRRWRIARHCLTQQTPNRFCRAMHWPVPAVRQISSFSGNFSPPRSLGCRGPTARTEWIFGLEIPPSPESHRQGQRLKSFSRWQSRKTPKLVWMSSGN